MEGNKRTALFALGALAATAISIFCYAKPARAADSGLIISEVLVGGSSADEEFIELYNPTSMDIDLKLLPLKLHIVSSAGTDTSKTLTYTSSNSTIKAGDYFLLASSAFKNKHNEISVGLTYSASLVSNGAVYISTSAAKDSNIIDSVCWGTSTKCAFPLPDPRENYSLERIGNGPDWQESCEIGGTPGKESKECEKEETPPAKSPPKEGSASDISLSSGNSNGSVFTDANAAEKVYLNEILPHPKGDEKNGEFIEVVNRETGPVDLFGWTIRDGSKTGKYIFKEHTEIKPAEYLAIYRPQSKLALNNSAESVTLFNSQGEITSSASWDKSIENSSYNFDGKSWRWSKYLTPGEENKFDTPPKVEIKKIKSAYKDLYTQFSASAKDKETKKLKYAWDFGDGKKSYLAKTSHKYLANGKYTVTLAVTDDSQTVEKSFALRVKKYPQPDLEIVKILPNPAGLDSEGETIEVRNNSGKKIALSGWKIATGSDGKLYNHPIAREFALDANETKTITQEFSKFSLNNKSGKVQLVMPDGKIADVVEYSKEKIADDEAYVKIDGEWQWVGSNTPDENIDSPDASADEEALISEDGNTDGEVLGATDTLETVAARYESGFDSEDAYIFLSQINFARPAQTETTYCTVSTPSSTIAYLIASLI